MQNSRSKKGFTIAEILLALTIASILLVAVAVAFNASATNFRENEDIFHVVNKARQALVRITSQIRTADAVDPNAPVNECSFITAAGEDLTYRYNAGEKKLYLVTNDNLTDPNYVLCDNVDAFVCTKNKVIEDSLIKVKSVQISMTVFVGDLKRTVATAAVVRRNLN